jgi:hypothetical protein
MGDILALYVLLAVVVVVTARCAGMGLVDWLRREWAYARQASFDEPAVRELGPALTADDPRCRRTLARLRWARRELRRRGVDGPRVPVSSWLAHDPAHYRHPRGSR